MTDDKGMDDLNSGSVICPLPSVICFLQVVFQSDYIGFKRDSGFYDTSLSFTGICIKSNFCSWLLPEQLSPFLFVPELRRLPCIYEVIRYA